jgi:hypothetical protein
MIMDLWNDRARRGEEVWKMFRFQISLQIRSKMSALLLL